MILDLAFGLLAFATCGLCAAATTTTSTSTGGSDNSGHTTLTITATAEHTLVWVTLPSQPATQIVYHQVFTAYWSNIAEPLSGSIGMGWIDGTVGESRNYPLPSPTIDLSGFYSTSVSDAPSGPLIQDLNTDSNGFIVSQSELSVVAFAGWTEWFGPTYSQNSQDLSGMSTTSVAIGTLTTYRTLQPYDGTNTAETVTVTGTTVAINYQGGVAQAGQAVAATTTTGTNTNTNTGTTTTGTNTGTTTTNTATTTTNTNTNTATTTTGTTTAPTTPTTTSITTTSTSTTAAAAAAAAADPAAAAPAAAAPAAAANN